MTLVKWPRRSEVRTLPQNFHALLRVLDTPSKGNYNRRQTQKKARPFSGRVTVEGIKSSFNHKKSSSNRTNALIISGLLVAVVPMLLQFVEVASWKPDMLLKREAHQALTVPGSNQEASRPKVKSY